MLRVPRDGGGEIPQITCFPLWSCAGARTSERGRSSPRKAHEEFVRAGGAAHPDLLERLVSVRLLVNV